MERRELVRAGAEVHLTPKALELLALLVNERPRAIAKSEIHDRLWPGTSVTESNLTTLVTELRKILGDAARRPRYVKTVHRFGYAFCGTATELSAGRPRPRRQGPRFTLQWAGGPVVALHEGENLIGREEGAEAWIESAGVSRRHARIVLQDGKLIIEDLKTEFGTHVNGRRITSPLVVRQTSHVRIGSYTLAFPPFAVDPLDEHDPYVADHSTEDSLLRAIANRDETSRIVYADWLEQQGDLLRAEFLRVQDELLEMRPGDAEFAVQASRLGALATQIDVAWRVRVASPGVERCGLALDFRCPMEWSMLQATQRDGVRHCTGCQKDVYYAFTVGEARKYAKDGHCVALDVTSARWHGDLAAPFAERVCHSCTMDIGNAYPDRECPHCGNVIGEEVEIVMGLYV
jgi:uncharacterized protein (TIGR02996 family)